MNREQIIARLEEIKNQWRDIVKRIDYEIPGTTTAARRARASGNMTGIDTALEMLR